MFARSTRRIRAVDTSTWQPPGEENGWQRKNRVVDAACDEYARLRDAGQQVSVSEFVSRYPSYSKSVRRMIDIYEMCDCLDDLDTTDDDPWPLAGQQMLGFTILEELGRGALARVYLATEAALGKRQVVVKLSLRGGYEAETLGRLNHPNIVPVHSVATDQETAMAAVCMPYLGSVTLADVLEVLFDRSVAPPTRGQHILDAITSRERSADFLAAARKRQAPSWHLRRGTYIEAVIELGGQLAGALIYTSQQKVLHRDLKPSNILITPSGQAMLLDFNLSLAGDEELRRLGGTLPYMPPEQIREVYFEAAIEGPPDPRSDIFSLAVVIYEMLTGTLPFGTPIPGTPEQMAEHYLEAQKAGPKDAALLQKLLPQRTKAALLASLAEDVSVRPTPHEFAATMRQYFAPAKRIQRGAFQHRRALLGTGMAAAAAASLGGFAYLTRPSEDERLFRQGVDHLRQEQYSDAVRDFGLAHTLNPGSRRILYGRGIGYIGLGEYAFACTDLEEVCHHHRNRMTEESRGYAHLKNGDFAKAGAAYAFAARYASRNDRARLLLNRAFSLRKLNRYNSAYRAVTEAIELDNQLQPAFLFRSQFFLSAASRDCTSPAQAYSDIQRAVELGPSTWFLHQRAALICAHVSHNSGKDLTTEIRSHVMKAAHQGAPRRILKHPQLAQFVDVAELPAGPEVVPDGLSTDDIFVTPPSLPTIARTLPSML